MCASRGSPRADGGSRAAGPQNAASTAYPGLPTSKPTTSRLIALVAVLALALGCTAGTDNATDPPASTPHHTSSIHTSYPQHLMGSALMNAVLNETRWHREGDRLTRGNQQLINIRPYPVSSDASLVALTACLSQSEDYRFEDADGRGWNAQDRQYILYLKRDTDGVLKVFDNDSLEVDSCDPRSAGPALLAEAAAVYNTTFALFEKHLTSGGLRCQDYPTSGLSPYLADQARDRMLWELEFYRHSGGTFASTGAHRPGRLTEWPRVLDDSLVALTSCFDRANITWTSPKGVTTQQPPRIYFAHFGRDAAGKLRMKTLDWIYVDSCG
ncbi:hypothetical protein ACPCG0_11530 [Propionibacteriaceae bacterium Y1923]